jgi:hypothetical protein
MFTGARDGYRDLRCRRPFSAEPVDVQPSISINADPHIQLSSPATGSAEWPPDDRLRRVTQYSRDAND